MWRSAPVAQSDRVRAPVAPTPERLRDAYFADIGRVTFGTVAGERWRLRIGPLTVLRFGEPSFDGERWTWPILGGLAAAGPGGTLAIGWRDGVLAGTVDGYRPLLPGPLYRLLQVPVHHLITRRFLLDLRGRTPPPGVPAGPAQRLVAAAIDTGVCLAATAILRPRRRLLGFALVAAAYHAGCWTLAGRTAGGLVTGQRVVSVDGSPVRPAQALLRLAALPAAAVTRRAVHDEVAETEVVQA